jgi:hypothetical protein
MAVTRRLAADVALASSRLGRNGVSSLRDRAIPELTLSRVMLCESRASDAAGRRTVTNYSGVVIFFLGPALGGRRDGLTAVRRTL